MVEGPFGLAISSVISDIPNDRILVDETHGLSVCHNAGFLNGQTRDQGRLLTQPRHGHCYTETTVVFIWCTPTWRSL